MKVDNEVLSRWKSLYQSGDKTKIAEQYCVANQKASLSTVQGWISQTFKFGHCPDRLYPVINSYYNKVEKQLKKIA